MIRSWPAMSAGQWVTRAAIAALPVVALLCVSRAGGATPGWLFVAVTLTSLGWAAFPESAAGVTVLAVIVIWWGFQLGSELDPLVLPVAAALLAAHVAAVLASYGPRTMRLDPHLVRLWVRRAALVYVPVPVLYLTAAWAEGVSAPAGVWPAGLAATFCAIAAASLTLSTREHEKADPGRGRVTAQAPIV